MHITTRICPNCGYQKPQDSDLEDLANVSLIAYDLAPQTVPRARIDRVMQMLFDEHRAKRSARSMLRMMFIFQGSDKPFKSFFYLCFDGGPECQPDVINVLCLTLCRAIEVASLRYEWIDFENKVITIQARQMKGKRDHRIPICS